MTIASQQKKLMALLQSRLVESVEADLSAIDSNDEIVRLRLLKSLEVNAAVMSDLATSIGLKGLARACTLIKNNFQLLSVSEQSLSSKVVALVRSWAAPLSGYFHSIGHSVDEDDSVDVIIDYLSDLAWPNPLSFDDENELKDMFSEPYFLELEQPFSPDGVITEQMGSLHVTVDVDDDMFSDFLSEFACQIEAFSFAVEQFLITEDPVQLRVAQRIVHTFKGSAKFVGIQGIVNLAHYIEDALSVAAHSGKVPYQLGTVLQGAADCLSSIEEYLSGCGPKPEDVIAVMQSVRNCSNQQHETTMSTTVRIDTSGLYKGAPHKVFHLENLIAFNDPGLNHNPPIFTPALFDADAKNKPETSSNDAFGAEALDLESSSQQSGSEVKGMQELDFDEFALVGAAKDVLLDSSINDLDAEFNVVKDPAVQLSSRQRHELAQFSRESQKCNARALERLDSLIASTETGEGKEVVLVAEIASLRQYLLEQSKYGLAIQALLSEICLAPQHSVALDDIDALDDLSAVDDAQVRSMHVLVVKSGATKVCLLVDSIRRILYVEENCLKETDEGCFYHLAGTDEPLIALKLDALLFPDNSVDFQTQYSAMVVVESEGGDPFGVLVESIATRQTQLIDALGGEDQNSRGLVVGHTMLDGEDAPVVDLQVLSVVES